MVTFPRQCPIKCRDQVNRHISLTFCRLQHASALLWNGMVCPRLKLCRSQLTQQNLKIERENFPKYCSQIASDLMVSPWKLFALNAFQLRLLHPIIGHKNHCIKDATMIDPTCWTHFMFEPTLSPGFKVCSPEIEPTQLGYMPRCSPWTKKPGKPVYIGFLRDL